jgi:succinate dehydrogenase/fumarate reductase flavoprotein subunit
LAQEKTIETDVLVIGGGIAGCFAAIKAKEKGADVILVDKGYLGRSGQTPFTGTFMVFNADWGHDFTSWMEYINRTGEYINNRNMTEIGIRDSYARYKDLEAWGVEFVRDKKGDSHGPAIDMGPCEALRMDWKKHGKIFRRQVVASGVTLMERIMVTDLLKQDHTVAGAVGISADSDDLYIFKAKAVVMCAGAGGFRPPGWPISELTSDGDAMAYRAGAEITGKEFPDPHQTCGEYPAHLGHFFKDARPIFGKMLNAEGDAVRPAGMMSLDLEFEAHAGRAPLILKSPGGTFTKVGGAAAGMSSHKTEGIWPEGTDGSTGIPGLFAAGDALGTMQSGARYAALGMAVSGSAVTGARAGQSSAEYALKAKRPEIQPDRLASLITAVYAPLERKGGFSPRWVTQLLQNIMVPYFIDYIKKEDRLRAALILVGFMGEHLVPRLTAQDAHELRLAHETKNMVLNAEMRLRASLFRKESRGTHYREDFPQRDDPDWLVWVTLNEDNGAMKVSKKPIPREWWPDLSKPYKDRYPVRIPGEKL